MNSYSPALYQLCQPSLESPCHCDLIASLFIYAACWLSTFEKYKGFFFFQWGPHPCSIGMSSAVVPDIVPLLIMAPPGALPLACLQLHWFFLWAHMACLRTMPLLLFFKSPLTSFSSWVSVICNGHMTLSSLLLHHLLDPIVWYFLELPAMSILPYWVVFLVV